MRRLVAYEIGGLGHAERAQLLREMREPTTRENPLQAARLVFGLRLGLGLGSGTGGGAGVSCVVEGQSGFVALLHVLSVADHGLSHAAPSPAEGGRRDGAVRMHIAKKKSRLRG